MSLLAVPLLRRGEAIGVITVRRAHVPAGPFTGPQIALLETFAAQAVIALENARLFSEFNENNATLRDALEQQTATAEVLQVISRSAFDLGAVLGTLVEHAVRLCGAASGVVYRYDGRVCRLVADHGVAPALRDYVLRHPFAADRGSLTGRTMLERRVVHIPDVVADPEYAYGGQRVAGYRAVLGVPLLRDGALVGVFGLQRYEPVPFTDREIGLVATFADQAVVAIENARLISELQERDERRRQELERASAIQQRLLPERWRAGRGCWR